MPTPTETFTPTTLPGTNHPGGAGGSSESGGSSGRGLSLLFIVLPVLGALVLGGGVLAFIYYSSNRPQVPGRQGTTAAAGSVRKHGGAIGRLWRGQSNEDDEYEEDEYDEHAYEEDERWDDEPYQDPMGSGLPGQ